jgi:HD-GYP domain-containing protein (c-di-GMP phosphodiesterase class II)
MDGSGYRRGIRGEEIHQFARIAAVSDVYDAVTSHRPYKAAAPPHVAVSIISGGSATAFDTDVVDTFRGIVFPYPVGTRFAWPTAAPASWRRSVDPDQPDVPLVRVADGDASVDVLVDTRAEGVLLDA